MPHKQKHTMGASCSTASCQTVEADVAAAAATAETDAMAIIQSLPAALADFKSMLTTVQAGVVALQTAAPTSTAVSAVAAALNTAVTDTNIASTAVAAVTAAAATATTAPTTA
jgi:hypothetical protein